MTAATPVKALAATAGIHAPDPPRILYNLQLLRAYAALSVAGFHFALVPAASVPWRFGSFGVDLFFVLSGYIIAYSKARDARRFLIRRALRVLPAYWIVTSLGAMLVLLAMPFGDALAWYGRSLLFLTGPDGRPPIIFVGWTLVYELAFYLSYAVALRLAGSRAPLFAMAALCSIAYGPQVVGLSSRTWPLLVEFALGLLVYLLAGRSRWAPRSPAPALLLVIGGAALLHGFEGWIHGRDGAIADQVRSVALGLPAAAVVLGLVWLEQAGVAIRSRFPIALGAASYAIYLLHPLVFSFVLSVPAAALEVRLAIFAGLMGATIAVSLFFYRHVEFPLLRWLRRHR